MDEMAATHQMVRVGGFLLLLPDVPDVLRPVLNRQLLTIVNLRKKPNGYEPAK